MSLNYEYNVFLGVLYPRLKTQENTQYQLVSLFLNRVFQKLGLFANSANTIEFHWLWHFMPLDPLHSNKHLSVFCFFKSYSY